MISKEVLSVALDALRNHRLRSALTMLGIIIGVAAMITMVALGQGAQKSVRDASSRSAPICSPRIPGRAFAAGVASDNRVSLTVDDAGGACA
jgi:putative ABC transport system permease protein